MATVRDIIAEATRGLTAAGVESARGDALLLLAAAMGCERAALITDPQREVAAAGLDVFNALLARRRAREPISHILGEREFWGLPFRVSAATLAPRPDSETVVEAALAQVADRAAPLRLLDLGTGTGCLLLSLLYELPNAGGVGIEKSPAAAVVAGDNARRLGLDHRARIVVGDWADALKDAGVFDLIISNPPYIALSDKATLPPEVALYEPAEALFAGADGLDAYRILLPLCARHLTPGGIVALELGAGQRPAVAALASAQGFEIVDCQRDLGGIERALVLRKEAGNLCGSAK